MHWLSKWFPEAASSYAADIDGLFGVIYWMTAVTFLLVMVLMVAFLFLYRARSGHKAVYSHGNGTLELIWTLTPALILIWLTFRSQAVWEKVRGPMPEGDVHIGVSAKQFNWFFHYPGQDGQLGATTKDGTFESGDNVQVNGLHVPVGKVVRISLASQDVIHSFFLPHMRLKQDAVPGRTIEVWFKAPRAGKYEVACAELCGSGHTGMRDILTVHEPADYAAWLKTTETDKGKPLLPGGAP